MSITCTFSLEFYYLLPPLNSMFIIKELSELYDYVAIFYRRI